MRCCSAPIRSGLLSALSLIPVGEHFMDLLTARTPYRLQRPAGS